MFMSLTMATLDHTKPLDNKQSKRCDICRGGSNSDTELYLGPWMQKGEVLVHYHCLLLSTHLPQEGEDGCGINGFYVRHIRAEIAAAGKRPCEYCNEVGASIQCAKCKCYFDINCGIRNQCLFEFVDEFKSYCNECVSLDEFQKKAKKNWNVENCYICKNRLGNVYSPTEYLYAPCCKNGFVHRRCMQQYAMSAGYYMRCIWCRDISLRQKIRFQGIFVPDREARWETKERFRDLHRGHNRCDMENCKCPRGREYKSSLWNLINCSFCGSFGVHFPRCIPNYKHLKAPLLPENFRCETCSNTERNMADESPTDNIGDYVDLYVCKSSNQTNNHDFAGSSMSQTMDFTFNYNLAFPQAEDRTVTSTTEIDDNRMTCNNSFTQDFNNDCAEQVVDESTKTDQECKDIAEIEFVDFAEDYEMIGTCKFRFNRNSPRFANKTMRDILSDPEIFNASDVVEQTGGIEPFSKVDILFIGKAGEKFLSENGQNFCNGNSL